ncbi:MAG: hypothetical protein HY347_12290 [candidate division NC10 bacterium]|nr:hypothetical protein [candidate division NC10 bacterium]
MKVIYHEAYNDPSAGTPGLQRKAGLIYQQALEEGLIRPDDVIEPGRASEEDLALVHTSAYIREVMRTKPQELVERALLEAQGSILTVRLGMEGGIAMNLGGGHHSAWSDQGRDCCLFNDPAVAIRIAKQEGRARRVLVVDGSARHGSGTESLLKDDPEVFTYSIHGASSGHYPSTASLNRNLSGAEDLTYMKTLAFDLDAILREWGIPDLVCFIAGADPYRKEPEGVLKLSVGGLESRDRLVAHWSRGRGIPLAVFAGSGLSDRAVTIHVNTLRALKEVDSLP